MTGKALSDQDMYGIDELEQIAHEEPGNVDIQRRWAWTLLRTNHAQQAKEVLEQASKKAPKDAEIWYALGVVQIRTNEEGQAKEAFKKVRELLKDKATSSPRLTMLNHMAETHLVKLG